MRNARLLITLFILVLLCLVPAVNAQNDGSSIVAVCPDGTEIFNAVEVVVNMRPGFTYTATALGVDGFDPVMAISNQGDVVDCIDDSEEARSYTANLPTSGRIQASTFNAQLPFSHSFNDFRDMSIIVGGFGGRNGDFVLILEGMAVTAQDGLGDPFSVTLTENLIDSEVPITAYMLATAQSLDPLIQIVADEDVILECDDAGRSPDCPDDMGDSYVSRLNGRETSPNTLNAMLSVPGDSFSDLDLSQGFFLQYLMTSLGQQTTGEYAVAFHLGIDDGSGTVVQQPTPDDEPGNGGEPIAGGGVDVVCPNGLEIFNGVEVIVNMRPGFTYTATVIGVDDFDPVMAVIDDTTEEVVDCSDDNEEAEVYSADLPTSGNVRSSNRNAQLPFSHNYNSFANIGIVVAGFDGEVGEFVLILEGMAVTGSDGTGDPFFVRVTPNMVSADIDVTAYMLQVDSTLDPYIRVVDSIDSDQTLFYCDDAGNASLCDGDSFDLSGSSVSRTRGRETPNASNNSMLTVPTTQLTDIDLSEPFYLSFLMTSYGTTIGEYVVAFHVGIGEAVDTGDSDL